MLLRSYRKRLQLPRLEHSVALEILMPRLSDSMEEGTIVQWLVSSGDRVDEGQGLVEVETDKASVVYEAETAGTVLALHAAEGESVRVGAPIAVIGDRDEAMPEAAARDGAARDGAARDGAARDGAARDGASRDGKSRPKASPLARRIAAARGVDLAAVAGSGPQGRVIRADVDRAAAAGAVAAPAAAPVALSVARGDTHASAPIKGGSTIQPLSRAQQTVARRMAESRATVPDIEGRSEVDARELVALRERMREFTDPLPSLNDFIVRAAALGLREFPRVNAAYRDAAVETFGRVNVGVAVAAEETLLVPTIVDADHMSVVEIGATARTLAARARDGSITPAELSGATFTVSNLGMYGIDSFSAVINPPQAAILAVGAMRERPVVDAASGAVVAAPTIQLTLACDHRVLNGVDGARYLTYVRGLLERPLSLLV
jgi:pyruvate dehydrogenase E2 component (dihydrolipoamide acetyltransferase)